MRRQIEARIWPLAYLVWMGTFIIWEMGWLGSTDPYGPVSVLLSVSLFLLTIVAILGR